MEIAKQTEVKLLLKNGMVHDIQLYNGNTPAGIFACRCDFTYSCDSKYLANAQKLRYNK